MTSTIPWTTRKSCFCVALTASVPTPEIANTASMTTVAPRNRLTWRPNSVTICGAESNQAPHDAAHRQALSPERTDVVRGEDLDHHRAQLAGDLCSADDPNGDGRQDDVLHGFDRRGGDAHEAGRRKQAEPQ